MKTRFFAVTAIAVLLLNVVGFAAGDTAAGREKKRQATRLVSLLPASDGVAVLDSKRFLTDALPKVLSANQPMLAEIMAKFTEIETRTGIDLRKFDQVVVGVAVKQVSPTNHDFDPVAVANGDINAGALLAIAKLASKGAYREEKIGDKTVYVFVANDVAQKAIAKPANSKVADIVDQALTGLTKEIAVSMLDRNTLVAGSLPRVRATIEGTSRVSADITGLLSVKETAVMSFAFKSPGGMAGLLPLENDELGINIDSIEYLSGSVDVATAGTSVQLLARTKKAEQAKSLRETLEGLQVVGGAIFGGSKKPDQNIYGRLIKSAKVGGLGNDVSLEVMVPQADINTLIAGIE